jgi:hypothetical protein
VAANVVPIALRAMAEGHDPETREGRCQLLESVLDEITTDENLVRCELSLERGDSGTALWRATSVDPDGRRIGWGLIETTVDNPTELIANARTSPPATRRCLVHIYATTPGVQWGDTTVDTVRIGRPIWIYRPTAW